MAMAVGGLARTITYLGDDLDSSTGPAISVSYSKFKQRAKSGDLILTSCPTSVSRVVTKSLWSHCGIIWRDPETDVMYEWSSHMREEGVMNTQGDRFGGCQLVPLDYLASSNGTVFWRQVRLDPNQRQKLDDFIGKMKYTVEFSAYPEFLAYFGPVMAKIFNGFGTGMVCSHTVAVTYMAIEAMANDRHLSQYCPETFAPTGDASWLVPISPYVNIVVGFDTSRLISFSGTTTDAGAQVSRTTRGRSRVQADRKNKHDTSGIALSGDLAPSFGKILRGVHQDTPVKGRSRRDSTRSAPRGSSERDAAKRQRKEMGSGHHGSKLQVGGSSGGTVVDSSAYHDMPY